MIPGRRGVLDSVRRDPIDRSPPTDPTSTSGSATVGPDPPVSGRHAYDLPMQRVGEDRRIGLVLGAGGSSGAAWIRGALEGLHERFGFDPEHSHVLIGTSIGAIKASGIGPYRPPPPEVVDALVTAGDVPEAPDLGSRSLAAIRLAGGRALALASRSGTPDPLTWVEHVEPDTRAQVCSVKRFPPQRRVAAIATSLDPIREIAASAAVPFGAQPVVIDGENYVDGAVWSVTNADLASPVDVDVLIVIAPLVATDGGTLVSALARHQLAVELRPWHRAQKPVIVLAPSGDSYSTRRDRAQHRADGLRLARGSDRVH